jgi:hypothetical protein
VRSFSYKNFKFLLRHINYHIKEDGLLVGILNLLLQEILLHFQQLYLILQLHDTLLLYFGHMGLGLILHVKITLFFEPFAYYTVRLDAIPAAGGTDAQFSSLNFPHHLQLKRHGIVSLHALNMLQCSFFDHSLTFM